MVLGIVHHLYARESIDSLSHLCQIQIMLKLNVYRFTVATIYGNTHSGRSDAHFVIMHNLFGFVDHLHLFFSVEIIQENVNLRNQVKSNGIMLSQGSGRQNMCFHFATLSISLGLVGELVNALLASARNSLVGGNNNTFNASQIIERLQSHNHDNGGAVGVGNNALMLQNILRVNLGHNQRYLRVHTEGAGVIDNHSASLHSVGSKLLRDAAASKESNINAFKGILGSLLHGIGFAHELNFLACATSGSQKTELCKREVTLFDEFQEFATNSTSST